VTAIQQAWRGGNDEGRAGWWIRFRYSEETVERLKRIYPSRDRQWNAEQRAWWIAIEHEAELDGLFGDAFAVFANQPTLF
jgi:hypothetical protein